MSCKSIFNFIYKVAETYPSNVMLQRSPSGKIRLSFLSPTGDHQLLQIDRFPHGNGYRYDWVKIPVQRNSTILSYLEDVVPIIRPEILPDEMFIDTTLCIIEQTKINLSDLFQRRALLIYFAGSEAGLPGYKVIRLAAAKVNNFINELFGAVVLELPQSLNYSADQAA